MTHKLFTAFLTLLLIFGITSQADAQRKKKKDKEHMLKNLEEL